MEIPNVRKPVVAGKFYPSSPQELKKLVASMIDPDAKKSEAIACVIPHAGYIYSGSVAAKTLSRINIKDTVILMGPNHTGYGPPFSLMPQGRWETPMGETEIDSELAGSLLKASKLLKEDYLAHAYEHSLEVELPFLQYFKSGVKIVPIVLSSDSLEELREIGEGIASAVKRSPEKDSIMLAASSDMTHYEPQRQAEKKDRQAIEAILELDEEKLMQRIKKLDISMCGYAPVIAMLKAAKLLGAKKAELIKYQTSADTTADSESVVGYAGIAIYQ